ncbi:hypothetical protein A7Q01_08885 [Eikenella sp. NML96-A-049]|uniref:DUF4189 domain-containing protein n=1 Tax=unclassified Eikenella TaxID=2639367 RepID=UPI0007E29482|nr:MULTISPECIES: DUF4189 domain-containing protein [unclassified Eikenella]OAM34753.1 hypothetical protein A7P97_06230 [Eikenella sp. NML070372]OAM39493.1 hypothetical protein A7Q01_08885 [Eikenella sp. NML96-A-049]VDG99906.1 Uncharacterised protein [Helicobacter pametensis]
MKQTMMNTAAGVLAAVLLGSAGLAYANPYPVGSQQWHNFNGIMQSEADRIQRERNAVRQQPINRGPTAAEIRAWEQREAEVQARIARFRATPYWMAIGWDPVNKGLLWPGGYRLEQRAIEAVQQNCRSSRCEILATFANSCAVLVTATDRPQSRRDIFVGIDRDDRRAAVKARQACTAARGEGDDRCFYSEIETGKGAEGTAFCVGYDHSLYNQR